MFKLPKFTCIILLWTCIACYEDLKKPTNLIPTSKFSEILRDVYTLQGLVDKQITDRDLKSVYYQTYKLKIFERHGIDSTTFAENYTFYQHKLDSFLSIHNRIVLDYNNMIYDTKN